jgi:hypothetical protein
MHRLGLTLSMLLMLSFTADAGAAPTARFAATPLQGSVCVAPCAVHFDAIGDGTTASVDPAYARAFHTLLFEWDFGDPAAGTWPTSGQSRNRALGAIAGHLYERPGTYVARLAVTNPGGQTHVATRQVVVTDPNSAFAASSTWCFANAGTPGGAGFEACPVRAASQHRVIPSTTNDGFGSALATCGASSRKVRCLFRAGDAFRAARIVPLASGAGPGLVSRFGVGARPRVVGGPGFLTMNEGWTAAGFDVELVGTQSLFNLPPGRSGITAANVRGTNLATTCFVTQTGSSTPLHNDRIGAFGLECRNRSDSRLTGLFLRSERTLVYGNVIDGGYGGEFNLRTVHFPRSVIAHNVMMRPQESGTNRRNNLQLRAWAGDPNPAAALPRPTRTEYVIVSDNVLSNDNNDHFVRTCQSNTCGSDGSLPQSMENLLFERNFLFVSRGGDGGVNHVNKAFWLQGGDITIRNNVLDLQGVSTTTTYQGEQLVDRSPNVAAGPNLNDDRIHVLNNTVYHDERTAAAFQFCKGGRIGTGHVCRNNLAWLPNQTGARRIDDGGWSAANNLFAGPNPFVAMPPPQGAGSIASFQLAGSGLAVDGGYFYPAADPMVRLDANNRCRPADGPDADATAHWDVGAFEAGAASACRRLP